jgi:aminopeptidase N
VGATARAAAATLALGPAAARRTPAVLTEASHAQLHRIDRREPVPSLLRGFSAPVVLDLDYSDRQLLTLLAHDTDPFNRWEAGQRLTLRPCSPKS